MLGSLGYVRSGVGHLEAKCKVNPLWRARPTSEDETTENGSRKGQQDWETVGRRDRFKLPLRSPQSGFRNDRAQW
jgi:hypothetical protein